MKQTLLLGICCWCMVCAAQEKADTFTVKKPAAVVVEEKMFPMDTFFLGHYNLAITGTYGSATTLSVDTTGYKTPDDFLAGVDSILTGKSIARAFNASVPKYDSIQTTNLKAEVRGLYLVLTAPAATGRGEVRLLQKRPTGEYVIVYRRAMRIVAAPVSRM